MKTFALMQPHFFPYIGYFYLMFSTDIFVYYDTAQFSHQSWQSRNRLLDQTGKVHTVAVPICHSSKFLPISQVLLSTGRHKNIACSFKDLTNRIESYYCQAPHASALREFLALAFGDVSSPKLIDLNIRIVQIACSQLSARLGKSPDFRLLSEVMECIPEFMALERVQRIVQCASILKCDKYITPGGSVEYMLNSPYKHELKPLITSVLAGNKVCYQQIGAKRKALPKFEGNLSILDLLANIGWDGIAELLISHDLYELKTISSFQSTA
jgi:hypothetical protein